VVEDLGEPKSSRRGEMGGGTVEGYPCVDCGEVKSPVLLVLLGELKGDEGASLKRRS
jgi:hypothetical protein